MNVHRLSATIATHDGRSLPFGPDEDPDRRLTNATFATGMPGGYGEGSLLVARPQGFDVLDVPLLAGSRMYGADGRTAHLGRVSAKPGSVKVGVNEITIELEAPAAELADDLFRFFYVSRDLARWLAPSLQRRLNLLAVNRPHQTDAQVITDDTRGAALRLAVTGTWDDGTVPRCETWLNAGSGLAIAFVAGDFDGWPDDDWDLFPFAADDDETPIPGADIYTDPDGEATFLFAPDEPHQWVGFNWSYTPGVGVTAGNENFEFGVNLRPLAAHGPHGLPLYDTDDGGAQGLRGSDILTHALGTKNIPIDYIEPSAVALGEAVFDSWTGRLTDVVKKITDLGGAQEIDNDWGFYEHGFFWRSPDSHGRTHKLRLDEGVELQGEGEDSAEVATSIVATYTDAAGTQRAVGFPGSGADTESALLEDTDPLNPAVMADLGRKVITKDFGRTTPEGAVLLARLALTEAIRTTRTGGYEISELPDGEAPFYVRAADSVLVENHYPHAQPLASTNYDHSRGSVEVDVGVPRDSLPIAIAQLNAGGA